jgi:hypothetical protein
VDNQPHLDKGITPDLDAGQKADLLPVDGGTPEKDPNHYTANCKPVVLNGKPSSKFNFVFAFYGLSQVDILNKGSDIVNAQFYRSQYKAKATDTDFGFVQSDLNYFQTRAGLFEIEPFKSFKHKFNIFYLSVPLPNVNDPKAEIAKDCSFIKYVGFSNAVKSRVIILRREVTPYPSFNTWSIEHTGTAFNHEIAHVMGMYDEYFTTMEKNNLSKIEVANWNTRIPNCDYGRPFSDVERVVGAGYCTKWCSGVEQVAFKKYADSRTIYDKCEASLLQKSDKNAWLAFCKSQLIFQRFSSYYYGYFPGIVVGGNPSMHATVDQACEDAWSDSAANKYYIENIENFCYSGTLYNIWDLDIGKNCMAGTGCYAGCGGFSRSFYSNLKIGAFGDAFRPHAYGIMGGAVLGASGPSFVAMLHKNDNELPSYGSYGIDFLTLRLSGF